MVSETALDFIAANTFGRLYFRKPVGLFPPRSKRDWLAMQLIQKAIAVRICELKIEKDKLKSRLIEEKAPKLEEADILSFPPDIKSVRSALMTGRDILKDQRGLRRQYDQVDQAVDDAIWVVREFHFNA
jgi:hypothetical protein